MSHTRLWDLEETPYETSDPNGGWYLHLSPKSGGDNVLYLSKANVSKDQALLLAAAPELLEALKLLTDPLYLAGLNQSAEHHPFIAKARLAIAKATGEKL